MNEKEKMIGRELYKAYDEEIFRDRQNAKNAIFEYNALHPGEIPKRNQLIRSLFGKVKDNFFIEPPFRCDYGYNIDIGENFYANYNCTILDCAKVIIGDNVMFGPNVSLYTAGHPMHYETRNEGLEYALPIVIGNNVWIGGGTGIDKKKEPGQRLNLPWIGKLLRMRTDNCNN